jgi:hypothetical protein
VDRPRDELFAHAALVANEHRHIAIGHLFDDRRDGLLSGLSPQNRNAWS